jgi:nucleotide-binding universal stress UspA family protein
MEMIERIVVGTDGSTAATNAVTWAAELAKSLEAELLLVHVFEIDPARLPGGLVVLPQEEWDRLRDESRERLEGDWSAPLRQSGARSRAILLDGNAAAALMEMAERKTAGLIVVGNRGRGGFAELLLGSVGHQLVQYSRIPVAIVPSR